MKRFLLLALVGYSLAPTVYAETREQEIARLRTQLAAGYYARGQYGVALDELKTAIQAESDYAPAYSVQGLVYSDLREYDNAERSFQKALHLTPNDPDANHNYGWFLCNKVGRYKESVQYFINAVKNPLYTTPVKSLQQAGLCALKAGDFTSADDYLHSADRSEPDNPATLLGMAQLAYRHGSFTEARTLVTREGRLAPPTAESLWLAARIEQKLGERGAQEEFEHDLRSKFPDSDENRKLAAGQYD